MNIKSITTEIKYIPLKTPFITALRRVENVEFVRVSVTCDNDSIAFGEAPATVAITGEDLSIITNSINSIKEEFISETPQKALTCLHQSKIGSSAKAALDMAFVSLVAQEQGKELYEYLGAEKKIAIKTDITISLNATDIMLQDATQAYHNGHDLLKIKLGSDINHAIEVTKRLSSILPKAKLLIDANQAWNLKDSLLYVNAVKDVKIELIEQPVHARDIKALKTITEATDTPILADEAAFSLEDVKQIVETKSADMINIKLMKCGGLTKAVAILEYARENGVKCMLGSMLEGPISIHVAMDLAMAYSDVIKYVDLDSPLLYRDSQSS
jgi:o-succinylbenzoate synthase